ncbi:MAG TPA: hypothetical protein VMT85_13515, partial [Thermoanaerobaculia bacterium]|nr:hypothetical protein [Thermoanaerobaculia bacterium]
ALRAAGIPFLVDGQDSIPGESFGGSFDPATHGGKIEVPAERLEQARELLRSLKLPPGALGSQTDEPETDEPENR